MKNGILHFYGPDGRLLGMYSVHYNVYPNFTFNTLQTHLYFGGKLIRSIDGATVNSTTGEPVLSDRLGSVRARASWFQPGRISKCVSAASSHQCCDMVGN